MLLRRTGFTIVELMIVIAIVAVLSAIAAPSLRDLVKNTRMTSLVNDLMSDLNAARGEAVKRGVRVSICTSNNGTQCTATAWNQGWIVFTDGGPEAGPAALPGFVDADLVLDPDTATPLLDVILKVSSAIIGANESPATLITSTGHSTESGAAYVTFRPSGAVTPGGASTIVFQLCDSRRMVAADATGKGRRIAVSGTGRSQSAKCTCTEAGVCPP